MFLFVYFYCFTRLEAVFFISEKKIPISELGGMHLTPLLGQTAFSSVTRPMRMQEIEKKRLIDDNPLFLDLLLRLRRKGLVDADIRSAFRLYGPILVNVSSLYLQLMHSELDEETAEQHARHDYDLILRRVVEQSIDEIFQRYDDYAVNHDPFGPAFTPSISSTDPPGLAYICALLAYDNGRSPINAEQKIMLEAIVAHVRLNAPGNHALQTAEPELFRQGEDVIVCGETRSDVLVVLDGELQVTADGKEVGRRSAGSVIGEMALLLGGVRTATVTVRSRDARVLRLNATQFRELLRDRIFLSAYAEVVARRSNHDVIGDVEQRRRLDGVTLEEIASDRALLFRQRIAFETLVRRRNLQGNSWALAGSPAPTTELAYAYLKERVRLARLLAWELGLDALAIQYAPDFRADTKISGGRASALTRADTMGQLKVMEYVKKKFPETDYVIGEEDEGADLFDCEQQQRGDYRWVVDPVDGTRNYSEGGTEWGIHVYCEFRIERHPEDRTWDRWIPLLSVKYSPKWNMYDDSKGGLMETWHQQAPISMNGHPYTLADRQRRVEARKTAADKAVAGKILCGSHPRLLFIRNLPPERFAIQGKYNSGLIQSMEYDLGQLELLSIGSPVDNCTLPHDAFTVFSALGLGGAVGVFDYDRDANGIAMPATGGPDASGFARTIVGEELAVEEFLDALAEQANA